MPKMKTHRGAAKRFKVTGSGKLMRRKAFRNHILEKKSSKRKRRLGREAEIEPGTEQGQQEQRRRHAWQNHMGSAPWRWQRRQRF